MIKLDVWGAAFLILGTLCIFTAWVSEGFPRYINAATGAACIIILVIHVVSISRKSNKMSRELLANRCKYRAGSLCLITMKECSPSTCKQIK